MLANPANDYRGSVSALSFPGFAPHRNAAQSRLRSNAFCNQRLLHRRAHVVKRPPCPCLKKGDQNLELGYRAVITDNLVIPARSIEAMALATWP